MPTRTPASPYTMAQPNAKPKTPATATYTVLRAICMDGKRIEVGDPVDMTPLQYAEARTAGKVGPFAAPAAKPAKKQKEADPDARAPDAATPEETPNVPV